MMEPYILKSPKDCDVAEEHEDDMIAKDVKASVVIVVGNSEVVEVSSTIANGGFVATKKNLCGKG